MIQGIIQMYTEAGVYQEEYPLSEIISIWKNIMPMRDWEWKRF
jgi:hypothetical protein